MSGLVIRPLRPADLPWIRVQPAQAAIAPELTPATGELLMATGTGFTALVRGRPVMAAGVVRSMGPPAIAWAVLGDEARHWLLPLTRAVAGFLAGVGACETGVARDFPQGRRWALLLGFRPTGRPIERWETSEPLELFFRTASGDG